MNVTPELVTLLLMEKRNEIADMNEFLGYHEARAAELAALNAEIARRVGPESDLETQLKRLVEKGLTFSDCVGVFGVRSDVDPYAKHAQGFRGSVEIDATTVISESDEGAYVMGWLWVANKDVWTGPTDSEGEPCRFVNHYRCDNCSEDWADQWSCACDDECPSCGKDFSPHESVELDITGEVIKI